MAFTSGGTMGGTLSITNSTTLAHTYTAAAAAGDIVIIAVASDDINSTSEPIATITDSVGNLYKSLGFKAQAGGSGTLVDTCIWYTRPNYAITISTVVTITFNASLVAKSCSAWKFTVGGGNTIFLENSITGASAAAANSLALSSLTNGWLVFRATGAEEKSTLTYTPSAGFTAITKIGDTGNPAAGNATVVGEFKIVAAGTETSAPTTINSDNTGVMVALSEITAPVATSIMLAIF